MEAVSAALTHVRASALALAAAAVAVLAAGPAAGTVVVAKDFSALCADADMIFVGTVRAVEPRWVDADRRSIETMVTFDELTWLQGEVRPSVTLRFSGGSLDGMRIDIAGVPRFTIGERRVIFAYDGTFVSPIVGFDQGAMQVVDGADGPHVIPSGSSAQTDGSTGALRLGTPAANAPEPLDAFLDRVRTELGARGGETR